MAEQFQPGDMVEWIGDDEDVERCSEIGLDRLDEGEIYSVAAVVFDSPCEGYPDVTGDGLEIECHLDPFYCYPADCFRKLYRPSADLIERLTAEPLFAPPVRSPERIKAHGGPVASPNSRPIMSRQQTSGEGGSR